TTQELDPGDSETVKVDFKGEPGERYRLRFDRGVVNHPRAGIDNLSFSQSERQPITKEQLRKAKETLEARIEKLSQELAKITQAKEGMAKVAARATKLAGEASDQQAEEAERRAAEARVRVDRLDKEAAELNSQLESATAEHAKLLEEQGGVEEGENDQKEETDQKEGPMNNPPTP